LRSLKDIIPVGAVVDSYLFYGGAIEFALAKTHRVINAYTASPYVYEFWDMVRRDKTLIAKISSSSPSKLEGEMFPLLQDTWHTYKRDFIRASMFFILNRCSSRGLISSGEMCLENFNPVALSYLNNFHFPEAFSLECVPSRQLVDMVQIETKADYIFIPCGTFSYNLFEEGKSLGPEETGINHIELRDLLRSITTPWILSYQQHPALDRVFDRESMRFIDAYGNRVTDRSEATELLISNSLLT